MPDDAARTASTPSWGADARAEHAARRVPSDQSKRPPCASALASRPLEAPPSAHTEATGAPWPRRTAGGGAWRAPLSSIALFAVKRGSRPTPRARAGADRHAHTALDEARPRLSASAHRTAAPGAPAEFIRIIFILFVGTLGPLRRDFSVKKKKNLIMMGAWGPSPTHARLRSLLPPAAAPPLHRAGDTRC